ncbi:uncharacterized protein (TIGR02271 family) [Murinocardiopsis flavida]|uniref:Uncharacterized protein (TIGR02271 family) n=1 Tax=Murinocardiopsis flavida TaxID=645275 RepID=A0A2P8D6I7_9ACTN|nr:PRC and DUF2382 domain-containing protein [Murinocardiopsis flavida]PSK92833.1 uncharacterized protein (TIGR02271 family) [Murinocardiopsis flavida]
MALQHSAQEYIGHKLLDREGHNVGKIEQVYFDDQTGAVKWVTVQTGMLGAKHSFVPLDGMRGAEDDYMAPYDKDTIKDAPQFDAERHLSVEEENSLYRHYGVQVPGQRSAGHGEQDTAPAGQGRHAMGAGTAATAADDTRADTADMRSDTRSDMAMTDADSEMGTAEAGAAGQDLQEEAAASMVRSEEQAHVGVEREESGRVRLHKSVETEHFERDVPLMHEEVRVERIPVTDAEREGGMAQFEEDDREVILYAERAVIATESVPVERVRLVKEEVTEQQHVEGDVRKERVDVEQEEREERGRADGA